VGLGGVGAARPTGGGFGPGWRRWPGLVLTSHAADHGSRWRIRWMRTRSRLTATCWTGRPGCPVLGATCFWARARPCQDFSAWFDSPTAEEKTAFLAIDVKDAARGDPD